MFIHKKCLSVLGIILLSFVFSCGDGCDGTIKHISSQEIMAKSFSGLTQCLARYKKQYERIDEKIEQIEKGSLSCFKDDKVGKSVQDLITKVLEHFSEMEKSYQAINGLTIAKAELVQSQDKLSKLAEDYNSLVEMFAACRTENFITKTGISQLVVDEYAIVEKRGSLLLHTVGDIFGSNSELEGNRPTNTLNLRLSHLQKLESFLKANKYIDDEDLAYPCRGMDVPFAIKNTPYGDISQKEIEFFLDKNQKASSLLRHLEDADVGAFHEELKNQLKNLKPKDSSFVTGGWTGHGFLYQFVKDSQDKYTFRVFNSGEGIGDYHAQSINGFETHFMPFVEVADLSLEAITLRSFIKSLMELYNSPGDKTKPEHLYERVLPFLGGKPSKIQYDAKDFKRPQQAGTCSYFSQPWVLADNFEQMSKAGAISKETFLPLQLEQLFGLKTIYDYWQLFKQRDNGENLYQKRALLQKSMVFFSSELADSAKKDLGDTGFMQTAANIEEDIKNDIDAKVKAQDELLEKSKTPAGDLDEVLRLIPGSLPVVTAIAAGGIIQSSFKSILNLDANFKAALVGGHAEITPKKDQYIQVINYIRELARSLPLESSKWGSINHEQALEFIRYLSVLQTDYVEAIIQAIKAHLRPEKTIYTIDFLTATKLLAVADMINQNFIEFEDQLPTLFEPRFGQILLKDLAITEVFSPEWQTEFLNLKEYFSPEKNQKDSIFDLHIIPAGAADESRRLMYDQPGSSGNLGNNKHWSDRIDKWNDVTWIEQWMLRHGNKHLYDQDMVRVTKKEPEPPFVFLFDNDSDEYEVSQAAYPAPNTVFGATKTIAGLGLVNINRSSTSVKHRKIAIDLLSGKAKMKLPESFINLRTISYGLDYLLTGNLSRAAQVPTFTRFAHAPNGYPYSLHFRKEEFPTNRWDSDWDINQGKFVYKIINIKEVANINKTTEFHGETITYSPTPFSFPTAGYTHETNEICSSGDKEQKEYICPNLHLQNGTMPFRKYEVPLATSNKNKENLKFNIQALMNIYSRGVKQGVNKETYDPLKEQERVRLLPNDLIIKDPYAESLTGIEKLTLERLRSVFTLSGIKRLQLIETLSIFTEYSSLLGQEEYQRLFEKLMFEPNLLLDQLNINEYESRQFIKKLVDFVTTNYERFKKYERYKEMAFILRMNNQFANFVSYARDSHNFKIPADIASFMDSPFELLTFIKDNDDHLTDSQRSFLFLNILDMYRTKNTLTNDDIANMITAKIKYNMFAITDISWSDKYLSDINKNVMVDKIQVLFKALGIEQDRNEILNRVAARFGEPNGQWHAVGPAQPGQATVYSATINGKTLNIDIFSGNFFADGALLASLPRISADFLKIMFRDQKPVKTVNIIDQRNQLFQISNFFGRTMRFKTTEPFVLQESINGIWYQFMDQSNINIANSPIFKKEHENWISLDGQKALVRNGSGNILYDINLNGKQITNVRDVLNNAEMLQLNLDKDAYPMNIFSRVEAPSLVEFWRLANNMVEVSLPRFNIKFTSLTADADDFNCAGYADYKISKEQYTKLLGAPSNYLKCELVTPDDKKPQFIYLMPAQRPYATGGSLSTEFLTDRKETQKSELQKMLVYEEIDGKLLPKDSAETYHLALRRWWQHDYQAALKLLTASEIELAPLSKSKREFDAIKWLMLGRIGASERPPKPNDNELQDQDPRAVALRLLAASILIAQDQEFSVFNKFFKEASNDDEKVKLNKEAEDIKDSDQVLEMINVAHSYSYYLNNFGSISDKWLPFYDEWNIAQFLNEFLSTHIHKEIRNAFQSSGLNEQVLKNRLSILKYQHPSRFESSPKISKLRPQVVQPGWAQNRKLVKSNHEVGTFTTLKNLINQEDLNLPAQQYSLLNLSDIFADQKKFNFFYTVASGDSLSAAYTNLAKEILTGVLGPKAKVDGFSSEDIRREFAYIFALSSLQEKSKAAPAAGKMARFYELVSNNRQNVPKLSAIKDDISKEKQIELEIKALEAKCTNIYQQIYYAPDQRSKDLLWEKWHKIKTEENAKRAAVTQLIAKYTSLLATTLKNKDLDEECFKAQVVSHFDAPIKDPTFKRNSDQTFAQAFKVIDKKVPSFDPFATTYLAKDDFQKIFNTENLTPQATHKINEAKTSLVKKLERAIHSTIAPSNVKLGINNLIADINDYTKKHIEETRIFTIKDPAEFEALKARIKSQIASAKLKADELKTKALSLVSKETAGGKNSALNKVKRFAELESSPQIEDLLYLLLTNNLSSLNEITFEDQSKKILDDIAISLVEYLLQSTFHQYLTLCNDKIAEYGKSSPKEAQIILNQIADLLTQERQYKFREHIEFLVFEYFMGIHLRKNQVEALLKLKLENGQIGDPNALGPILEMIMGFGKTKVLLPILSAMNTKGDWLNLIMLPEALITSMAKDLRRDIGKSFNRAVYVLEISRQSNLSEEGLNRIYDRLVRAKNEKSSIVTTNSSVQSLFLTYIELLDRYEKDFHQVDKKLTTLSKIFRFLRTYGRLTIDEVDMALDVLKSHQFSVGERSPLHGAITATIFGFYRMLALSNLKDKATLSFLKGSSGPSLTEATYKNLKNDILNYLVNDRDFFGGAGQYSVVFNKFIDSGKAQLLKDYLLDKNIDSRLVLFKEIDKIFANNEEKVVMKNISSVLYEEISQTFLLTAAKKIDTHYGEQKEPVKKDDESDADFKARIQAYENSKYISVPFHAGSPAPMSRFGSPIEAVNYTIQQGLIKRNLRDQLDAKINALKVRNMLSASTAVQKDIAKQIKTLFGVDTPALTRITDTDLDNLAAELKTTTDPKRVAVVLDLIKEHALSQLKTYETQLYTNAQIYGSLFKTISGFSGTLWSIKTFPDIFKDVGSAKSDTTAKTFMLLWQQYLAKKELDNDFTGISPIVIADTDTAEDVVNKITHGDENISIMDMGGILRVFTNLDVAKAMLPSADKAMGIIHYDSNDEIVVLGPAKDIVSPIETTIVKDKELRLAYWDKKHTTGSDFKLRAGMVGRMTFDHHSFSRDIEQTAWRLRGLADGQSVDEYVVIKEDLKIILTKMKQILGLEIEANEFDLGDLLLFGPVNQEVRLGDLLHRALKYKMSSSVSKEALDRMFAPGANNAKAYAVYKTFSSMFKKNINADPFIYMGFPLLMESKDKVLKEDKEALLSKTIKDALLGLGPKVLPSIAQNIDNMLKENKGFLPETLKNSKSEVGLEVEIEQELEKEEETEKEVERYDFNRKLNPHVVIKWDFAKAIFSAFVPVSIKDLGKKDIFEQLSNDPSTLTPIFNLKEALGLKDAQKFLSTKVDANIFVSLNWAPMHHRNAFTPKSDRYHFEEFFILYQKAITNILVLIDDADQIKTIILDGNDAKQLDKFLPKHLNNSNTKLGLYSLSQGMFRQTNGQEIDIVELENKDSFIEQVAQIKFLGGYLNYTDKQKDFLKHWLSGPEKHMLFKLFKDRIIHHKQDTFEQLNDSDIGEIFDAIGVK